MQYSGGTDVLGPGAGDWTSGLPPLTWPKRALERDFVHRRVP